METILNIFWVYMSNLFVLLLFLKVTGIFLNRIQIFISSFIIFLITALSSHFIYIFQPLYFIVLSFSFSTKKDISLNIFYGLFPIIIFSLFRRAIRFFLVPLFFNNFQDIANNIFYIDLISFIGVVSSYIFLNIFEYDFSHLENGTIRPIERRILLIVDISMISYYIISQSLILIEDYGHTPTSQIQKAVVAFYLILFFILIAILDRHIKRELQMELLKQKEEQMKSLSQYSSHIEELYKEIRSFRHDYINILTSLRLGIENRDLPGIEKIYHQVLEKTEKQMQNNRYDFGHLMNLKNEALKSVLSAKILEAQNKGIAVGLEIPEIIETFSIEPLDLITIVSIMCDNAIEAAFESSSPEITLALFEQRNALVFIIQNTTKEERIEVNKIFNEGYSTKGQDRGLGLTTVKRILDNYPKANLQTKSHSYLVEQILII
ncbi:sensor histidine kinase [Streptococcus ferus]|uniref:sensor histidine kinase n=1 Tax=Streptococcus ferus TaxID=1345 RepID=UPI0035A0B4D6